ncbi:hypothetical protein C2I18_02475 [Paenibacillus sp. PK3_47]|uniref:hypothetical protein n=1 Tax=Paenibacillus sp. PK3_47 TaxID=2072642 RepID=UPI00201DECFF|nr:hypothetical protein [Paenibacillus sp. PK3_47]UQZ32520.1 hypothetical protein C2I18_02475 [Paenibacillus sp. PK3_47]
MGLFRSILHFFIPRERALILTTFNQEQYFRAKARLASEGIPQRSKITGGTGSGGQGSHFRARSMVQHDLYVRKEDEHRAASVIHQAR